MKYPAFRDISQLNLDFAQLYGGIQSYVPSYSQDSSTALKGKRSKSKPVTAYDLFVLDQMQALKTRDPPIPDRVDVRLTICLELWRAFPVFEQKV